MSESSGKVLNAGQDQSEEDESGEEESAEEEEDIDEQELEEEEYEHEEEYQRPEDVDGAASVWPPPYDMAFDHLQPKDDFFVDNEDAYYTTDLESEDECKERWTSEAARIYLQVCLRLGIVPVSYYLRHVDDERLVLRHHSVDGPAAKAIAASLTINATITELDLSENCIGPEGAVYMAEALVENSYITHLNLASNGIGDTGAQAICNMLQSNAVISRLNLSRNGLTPKLAVFLSAALMVNDCVVELNLSHNQLGEHKTGLLLQQALAANTTLNELDLSWNCFRSRSAVALVKGLELNKTLTRVSLAYNGLSDNGAAALGRCARLNKTLRELDVSNNRISANGARVFATGLKKNTCLEVLRVGKNPLTPAGALMLLAAVNNNASQMSLLDIADVCVKKDFDDLYSKITDTGRELRVVHGGVVELSYQPLPTARHLTLAHHPFGTSPVPVPEKQAPAEQDAAAAGHEQVIRTSSQQALDAKSLSQRDLDIKLAGSQQELSVKPPSQQALPTETSQQAVDDQAPQQPSAESQRQATDMELISDISLNLSSIIKPADQQAADDQNAGAASPPPLSLSPV